MYYRLTYYIQNAQEYYLSEDEEREALQRFYHRLSYLLTNGKIRSNAERINFVVVKKSYHGFEVIVSYPDHFVPGKTILFTILQDQEALFDAHFFDKPVNFAPVHLHQISAQEFMMSLCKSENLLQNAQYHITSTQREYYGKQEDNYNKALQKLNQQAEKTETEKENHVL